jgi:hypothetical protein
LNSKACMVNNGDEVSLKMHYEWLLEMDCEWLLGVGIVARERMNSLLESMTSCGEESGWS